MPRDSTSAPNPGEGKTYSLFGNDRETDAYFDRIRLLADDLVRQGTDIHHVLESVRKGSRTTRHLKKLALRALNVPPETSLARILREELSQYTVNVASHLRGLSLAQRCDRVLATSEEQYHCLHDITVTCQSVVRGDDHVCKGCSMDCALNAVSKLLRRHGMTPYIWVTANLPSLFRRLRKDGKRVGLLGIACIPELVRGMRLCTRADVPVIGLPLDANRCARWWGQFYPNSVNIQELERLLGGAGMVGAGTPR